MIEIQDILNQHGDEYRRNHKLPLRENITSIKLHEKCGFRKVGIREKISKMNNEEEWHDVVLMERRSQVVEGSIVMELKHITDKFIIHWL